MPKENSTKRAKKPHWSASYANAERDTLSDEVMRLREENEQLQKQVGDLQSGLYINCVYCGHRYGPNKTTPASMADVLKEHVEQCSRHPMSHLRKENDRMREAILCACAALGPPYRAPDKEGCTHVMASIRDALWQNSGVMSD